MGNYQKLQKLYLSSEVAKQCADIDFTYAFICAMASSELELEQWMPLLFLNEDSAFTDEKLATDFAQTVLAIYQQNVEFFQNNTPVFISTENNLTASLLPSDSTINFASGYLQALLMLDNMQTAALPEDSVQLNLQQTCLLLLDKLASVQTQDPQKLAMFEQLPSHSEIVSLLPTLLSRYGHHCLLARS